MTKSTTKLTIEYVHKIAKEKGFECLSISYVNNKTKLKFLCPKGHQFFSSFNSIDKDRGCGLCRYDKASEKQRTPILKIREIAESKGFILLSEYYKNGKDKIKLQCLSGHITEKRLGDLQQGYGCKQCANLVNVGENIVRVYFETIFKSKFPNTRPNWLLNPFTGNKLELDGYSEELGIAFERHGEQHYSTQNLFMKTDKELKYRQEIDVIKENLCLKNRIKLFIIDYKTPFKDLVQEIKQQSLKMGLDINKYDFNINIDYKNISNLNRLQEIKDLAKSRGIICESSIYINSYYPLEFTCSQGHKWKSTPTNFKTRAFACKYCSVDKVLHKSPKQIQAKEMFEQGVNNSIIAKILEIEPSMPRMWAKKYNWERLVQPKRIYAGKELQLI